MRWIQNLTERMGRHAGKRKEETDPPPLPPEDDRLAGLTPREREVCSLLLLGKKQREIAETLGIRPPTVSFHVGSLYRKLGIHDRAQLFIQYAGRLEIKRNEGERA